jgi:multicomponent Na+:H+ antiporter subunit B
VRLLALGLLVMQGSGVPAMLQGRPFLPGLWVGVPVPWGGEVKLGTPQL